MKRRDRIYFLLAAGMSLGVHATAAVYISYTSPTDGLNQPPTQIVQLSLVAQRAAPPTAVPDPVPEAVPPPVKPKPPTPEPKPKPVAPRVQPKRPLPTPKPETW